MKRSLSFRARVACEQSGELIDVLGLFFGRAQLDMTVLDDEIQNALKTSEPLPDSIVLFSFGGYGQSLVDAWKSNPKRANGLTERAKGKDFDYLKELSIWNFFDARFRKIYQNPNAKRNFDFNFENLMFGWLANLVDERGAYVEAPSGHFFRHPSGRESTQFLMASSLLRHEIDAYFVALCVAISVWEDLKGKRVTHIDTMGIYPIARALEEIIQICSPTPEALPREIDSFHSHEGLANLHEIMGDDEIVLISASTSGSMARSLAGDGVVQSSIITLLDLSMRNRVGTVLYARDKHVPLKDVAKQHGSGVIELVGEYFSARGNKPRAITLGVSQTPNALKSVLSTFAPGKKLQLHKRRAVGFPRVDDIGVDERALVFDGELLNWLKAEIKNKTPISVNHIIYGIGIGAKNMAVACASIVREYTGRNPTLSSHANIKSLTEGGVKGVLVCAAFVGNGHELRSIARDLREVLPNASRHFITAIGFPETALAWSRLKQFLVQSASRDLPYVFSSWKILPTGIRQGSGASWQRQSTLRQKLDHIDTAVFSKWKQKQIQDSIDQLGNILDDCTKSFLPSANNKVLRLTQGFVYWDPGSAVLKKCNHAAVSFLAICCAIQNARESAEGASRLESSMHECAILDPENFLRFNDGVLQASLLRAASAHELDYSKAPALSEIMRELLDKVFTNHAKSYGEAALEFGFALATGHLRLTGQDKKILLERMAKALPGPTPLISFFFLWEQASF